MDLTVALDLRYSLAPDGSVWSQVPMARAFWERYLDVFDRVRIVARAARTDHVPQGWLPVTGKDIVLHALPDYCGAWQCVKRYPALRAAVHSAVPARGAVILRVASQVANMLEGPLHARNRPYALEVVGDPYEVFAPGVVNHPLRPYLRWHFSRRMRQQCLRATGVAYVTKRALQERYPTRNLSFSLSDVDLAPEALRSASFSTHYSSIELDADHLITSAHTPKSTGPYQLVTVGSLAQLYKGTDVLIEAVAICVRAGLDVTAVIVGDGKHRGDLMAQAERAGIATRIQFPGQVTAGGPVRRFLDASDLFVLPSRTEGLPRALIEAMARGLPCIGSAVGGIPELLEAQELVPVGDAGALANKIQEVLRNPLRMTEMSLRNVEVAREYAADVLRQRRHRFYEYVRYSTETWEARQET